MEGPECAFRHLTFPDFSLFPLGYGRGGEKYYKERFTNIPPYGIMNIPDGGM